MKYIITWNAGYGENYEVIEADSHEEAFKAAYEEWRNEAEDNADYSAEPWTQEREEELQ